MMKTTLILFAKAWSRASPPAAITSAVTPGTCARASWSFAKRACTKVSRDSAGSPAALAAFETYEGTIELSFSAKAALKMAVKTAEEMALVVIESAVAVAMRAWGVQS